MANATKLWKFKGRVKQFDHIVQYYIEMETYAVTEKHARRNLTARYKRDHGYTMNARIELEGTFTSEEISKVS